MGSILFTRDMLRAVITYVINHRDDIEAIRERDERDEARLHG